MNRYFIPAILVAALISCAALTIKEETFYVGVNLVGTSEIQKPTAFDHLEKISANSVAIVPFAYGKTTSGHLTIHTDWQWWGESIDGSKSLASMAKSKGLHVMIKPQIWFDWGTFTGDVKFDSEEKWVRFERGYEEYMLAHAQNAEEVKADILCIGTELKEFVINRPEFWNQLIQKVQSIYSGKLTYAGNWDSYKLLSFWNQLDYIGVDAYFPISKSSTPTVNEVISGWKEHTEELRSISKKWNKKILFCEYGYRSTSYTAKEPWDSGKGGDINMEAQKNCYEGTFQSIWQEDFMAGGFLWKWYPNYQKYGGKSCNRFTPQNKPAESTIRTYYSK